MGVRGIGKVDECPCISYGLFVLAEGFLGNLGTFTWLYVANESWCQRELLAIEGYLREPLADLRV